MIGQPRTTEPATKRRTGITVIESAVTLLVLLGVLMALLDLGIAAVRYNALANVARQIARDVILHGAESTVAEAPWGPEEFTGTIADASEIVASAQGLTPTMAPGSIDVRVAWTDGDNSPRDPVQVEVRYRHEPIVPALSVWGAIELEAISTMRIVN